MIQTHTHRNEQPYAVCNKNLNAVVLINSFTIKFLSTYATHATK